MSQFFLMRKMQKTHLSRKQSAIFAKIIFPPFLAAILNFCIKCKTCLSQKLSEIERFRQIFDPQGIRKVYWPLFAKIIFMPLLAAILNFCVKCKNMFILITEQDSDFYDIFDPQGICRVYWRLFAKIVFSPLLAAILNFCIKCKTCLSRKQSEIE